MDVGVTEPRPDARGLSFDDWAEARVAALLRFAYLVTGSQHAAEDAVQSALTRACEKWSRVRQADDPDAYVRRMVVNAHVSSWRKAGRRESPVAEVRETTAQAARADPVDRVVEADAVWRVCSRLPAQQRAVVVLRFYEDLDYDEIAAVLDISPVSARTYVHRALTSLRAELTSEEDGDG
jgi:RNA polymerase sigma-70 factor (sigma-E family)